MSDRGYQTLVAGGAIAFCGGMRRSDDKGSDRGYQVSVADFSGA